MKLIALIASLLVGCSGIYSTWILTHGTAPIPWEMQSYSGKSERENTYRQIAERKVRFGFIAMGVAFALSALSAIAGYFS